jgi:hypothetical protein
VRHHDCGATSEKIIGNAVDINIGNAYSLSIDTPPDGADQMTAATHLVIDTRTGSVVARCASVKAARAKRDRLDAAYGAVRYTVRAVEA